MNEKPPSIESDSLLSFSRDAEGNVVYLTPEERVEFEMWERLGDEAWAMIDGWEKEDGIARDSDEQPRTKDTES